MPQTVALQRGSTSLNGNGATFGDLFTQSSGIATRVVLNGIACWSQTTGDPYVFASLLVKSAGSTTNVLTVGSKSFGNATTSAFDMSPSDGIDGNFTGYSPTSTVSFANKLTPISQLGSTNLPFGAQSWTAVGLQLCGGGTTQSVNNGTATYFSVPRDFWIGPSDVVSMKIYSNNGRTWTIAYSFTTITES
jgi:hypothetical protein